MFEEVSMLLWLELRSAPIGRRRTGIGLIYPLFGFEAIFKRGRIDGYTANARTEHLHAAFLLLSVSRSVQMSNREICEKDKI